MWKKWCVEKKIEKEIQDVLPVELNISLERFYAEVKNKQGEDYEPGSLKMMLTALDRHLKDNGYNASIMRGREFSSSKQVVEGKAKELRKAGLGKRPNKTRQVSAEEEEILWKTGKFW